MSITTKMRVPLDATVDEITESIKQQMESRAYRASNELRNSALNVLRGQRGGRRYKVPGTYRRQKDTGDMKFQKARNGRYYTASAPGEPPAVRTGMFRLSWQPKTYAGFGHYISRIENNTKTDNGKYVLGEILENGTSRMAPRPYEDRILERAEPKIVRIYSEPYD